MNNENNPKFNESQVVKNIDVNQSGEAPKAVKKTTIAIAVVLVVVSVGLIILGVSLMTKGGGNTAPVNTEFATTPEGVVIIEKGTNPQGVVIENGTYPDGTVVEIATTAQGEPATEADGSYVIVYPTYSGTVSTHNSNEDNNNTSSGSSNSKSDVSSSSTVAGSSQGNTANSNGTSSSSGSTDGNSASSNIQSDNQSSSSQTGNTVSSSSSSSTSSTTGDVPGSSSVTINGSSYNVGDRVKVTYYMESSVKFAALDCEVNYDGTVLKLDKDSIEISNLANVMSNAEEENMVAFICASATAVNDFSEKKEFFTCEFEIQKSNTVSANVVINVVEMLDNDIMNISSDKYAITSNVEKVS